MKHSASGTPHMKPVASASVEGEQKVTHVKVGSYTDSKPVSGNKVAGEVKSQTQGKSPIQSAQTDERELVQAEGHATSDTQVDAMLRQLDLSFLLKEIKGGISFVIKPQKMDASGIRFKQIPDSVKVMQKTADGSIEITGDAEAAKQVLSSLLMDLGGSRAVSLGINVVQHNMMLVDTKIAFYADSARDSGYRTVIETKHLSVNGYHSQSLGFIASSDYLHNGNSFRFGDKQVSVDPATVIQVSNPVPVIGVDTNSVTPAVTVLPSIQTTLPEPTTTTSAPSQTTSITTTTPTTTTPSTTTTLPTTPTPSPATPVVPATPVIPVLPPHVAPLQGAPTVSAFARASNEDIATTFALAHFTAAYTDPDNDALSTITIETLPANGDLKLSGVNITLGQVITAADIPNITFVPTANWHGATSFQYKASDGFGDSNTQLITINIACTTY